MTEEVHTTVHVPNDIASATAFTISGGLPGPIDARPSGAAPIIRALGLGGVVGGAADTGQTASGYNLYSGGDPIDDASNVRQNAIHPVRASAQDTTTRQLAFGGGNGTFVGDVDALELWVRIRGKDRQPNPL